MITRIWWTEVSATAPSPVAEHAVLIVGAGPTGTSLLERLLANAPELIGPGDERRLTVHLVDPYPAGGGRTWRPDQSPLMWANSTIDRINALPDSSVSCAGPVEPGPTLAQWLRTAAAEDPDPAIRAEARQASDDDFPSRRLVGAYLSWIVRAVIEQASPHVEVRVHRATVTDIRSEGLRETVTLDSGRQIPVDAVILAQGRMDAAPEGAAAETARRSGLPGLVYLPAQSPADADLGTLEPGQDVLVIGAGLSFIDLMVLLTSGRGGRFEAHPSGIPDYRPSGREPRIVVTSRRGIPLRTRLGYRSGTGKFVPRHLTDEVVEKLIASGSVALHTDVVPLIHADLTLAYYQELSRTYPERVAGDARELERVVREAPPGTEAAVDLLIPDPADRLDLTRLFDPLAGLRFDSLDELNEWTTQHLIEVHARSRNPRHSPDAAVITALQAMRPALSSLVRARSFDETDGSTAIEGWWQGAINHLSGMPAPRAAELVSLVRAGIVTFLGPLADIRLDTDLPGFVGSSSAHDQQVSARALVDARLPRATLTGAIDPLSRATFARGEVREARYLDPRTIAPEGTGRIALDAELRIEDSTGDPLPRRFAVGKWTSSPNVAALSAPGTNALFFRQNDQLARRVLTTISAPTRTIHHDTKEYAMPEHDEPVVAVDRLVTAEEAARRVAAGAVFIDVRSEASRDKSGAVTGARPTDRHTLADTFGLDSATRYEPVLSYDTPIVVVCGSVRGSGPVVAELQQRGFTDVTHIDGGFSSWQDAGLPTEPPVAGA